MLVRLWGEENVARSEENLKIYEGTDRIFILAVTDYTGLLRKTTHINNNKNNNDDNNS